MSNFDARPRAIFLMGPTASGKTALAMRLADRFNVGLISVDSALVYRGLDVGSAKPDQAMLTQYPHRLINTRDPSEVYSASWFRDDAMHAMTAIAAAGSTPLLVGGTNLYFRALQGGLSALPAADASFRATLNAEAQSIGWRALHARLATVDPIAAKRIQSGDTQRISRALEVIALTGAPLSQQQRALAQKFPFRVLKLALLPEDRAMLHARIEQRLHAMFNAGFIEEVRKLRERGDLHADLPAMRAVGYRQIWDYLSALTAQSDTEDARAAVIEKALFATRQLAKRQITWLRSDRDAIALDPFDITHSARAERVVAGFVRSDVQGPGLVAAT